MFLLAYLVNLLFFNYTVYRDFTYTVYNPLGSV